VLAKSPTTYEEQVQCQNAAVEYVILAHIPDPAPRVFQSCFLSYSARDSAFAEHLYLRLQRDQVNVWFAPKDLPYGDKIRDGVQEALLQRDRTLVILSQNSVSSQWVETEVETAMEIERKTGRREVLLPLAIDDSIDTLSTGWAADIRRIRNIGRFHNWHLPDVFEEAYARLLSAIRRPADEVGKSVT
jgi:hypothetical protein